MGFDLRSFFGASLWRGHPMHEWYFSAGRQWQCEPIAENLAMFRQHSVADTVVQCEAALISLLASQNWLKAPKDRTCSDQIVFVMSLWGIL